MATMALGAGPRIRAQRPVKVAAVCYRRRRFSLEFLLVNTASGRWTFPKGNVEPGLSPQESAALEALEEAGVRGRISSRRLHSYLLPNSHGGGNGRERDVLVAAYLLEVRQTVSPLEPHRNPTWFKPRKAKMRLAKRRPSKYKREMARVIDRAVEIFASQSTKRPR